MATATADRAPTSHKYGWLRRIDSEIPLRLPLEPPRVDMPESIAAGPELGPAGVIDGFLTLDLVETLNPLLSVTGGGSVVLDNVDARRTKRSTSRRQRGRTGRSTGAVRRRPQETGLSLAERLLLVLQPPLEALLEQGILEWPSPLRAYQYEGVQALVESESLLLADDMGLGKTIQAIAALRVLIHLRRVRRALIVVPVGLVPQWDREFAHWAPELRTTIVRGTRYDRARLWESSAHIFLVGYETLREDFLSTREYGPAAADWDVVVLDEAQKIKNPSTRIARACKSLYRERAWVLTGTPLENSLDDLSSIVQFLAPYGREDTPPPALWGHQLLDVHRELQLRRRKEDVLKDLPPKSVNDLWLPLAPRQRETYDRAEREGVVELRHLGEKISITNVLALIQRLKEICNVCPTSGESSKLTDLSERLTEIAAEGQRALVFSQYVQDDYGVGAIVNHLDGEIAPLGYSGGLSAAGKERVLARFRDSDQHKALVLSLRAGGQGLNLQEASYVFHFDRWWNPAVERQAEDRTHRIGQQNAVTVYRYICEGTIEERIDRILQEKQALFDEYVDKVSLDPGKMLGAKAIFGLFGLEPPAKKQPDVVEELA